MAGTSWTGSGPCAATTTSGTGDDSGFALSRGLTLAHLVTEDLAGGEGD